jgi:hypothetical protein
MGAEAAPGDGVRAHETAAAAVGPGKKSEGGEGKAEWAGRRRLGQLAGGPIQGRGEVGRGWAERPDRPAGRRAESERKILF